MAQPAAGGVNGLSVVIVGGGIGGLTCALSLAADGHRVTVLEQAAEFTETGAGLQLSPNCSRVLHALGLEQALREVAFLPEATQFRNWRTGRVIAQTPLGEQVRQRYGAPYYHIHRGDLLALLVAAAQRHPGITLRPGCGLLSFQQHDDDVSITAEAGQFRAELLVGADGIHSIVRSALWGPQAPDFTGNVAWRALVPAQALPQGLIRPMSTVWWGPGAHFVHYYVRGGELVNCVCVVEKSGWTVESWTEPGSFDELKADFAGWHEDLQQLLDRVDRDSLFKWALYDRPPMAHWSSGRVTLLGDACHPTLPFMAQGAAMAIEDAAVLAGCMQHDVTVQTAILRYESLRRDRTASIQRGSRRNATVFHLAGVKAWMRDRGARAAGAGAMHRLYSYDALQVARSQTP